MANILKNFLDSLHLSDDDDDDDEEYADYVAQVNSRERRQNERREKKEREPRPARAYSDDEEELEGNTRNAVSGLGESRRERERAQKAERQASKVVPFRGGPNGAVGIRVMKPTSIEDSQDICDVLLSGRATIINLEGFDADQAQRVMDFISGAVYAIQGRLHQISAYIFIISPENVDIAGDYLDMIRQSGFEVPVINRD